MPEYMGPVFATLSNLFMVSFVGEIFLLCFIFGFLFKLLRGDK